MSNPQQAVAAIAGGVIGWFVGGGPVGAAYGFQIGLLAGSVLYPTQLPHVYGPRIEDLAVTNATLGIPIPYIYGTVAVPGFVMYLNCAEEVATTEEIGGKGAPEQSQTTYTYFQTLAVGLCEGEISGLLRVWENGELKYDMRPRGDEETEEAWLTRTASSAEYAAGFTLYLGSEDQMPDPTLEAELGEGNVPAFRGLAYMVFPERQLTDDQARRHPQFRFEIYKAAFTGPEIVFPTEITGMDSYQTTPMATDFLRNRYFTLDLTGSPEGLRAFSLSDNTELAQIYVEDLVANPGIFGLAEMTVDPRTGYVYLFYFVDNDNVLVSRIDPVTYEELNVANLGSGFWHPNKICVFRQNGAQQTRSIGLCSRVLGGGDFFLYDFDNMAILQTFEIGSSSAPTMCQGRREGSTSFAYGIQWNLASSGIGNPIQLHEFYVSEIEVFGTYVLIQGENAIQEIQPSDIDPTWTRFSFVAGAMFDESDECIVFQCTGAPAASGAGTTYLVKYDPVEQEVVWVSGGTSGFFAPHVNTSGNQWQSSLANHSLVLSLGSAGMFRRFDLRTGESELIDLSDDLSSSLHSGEYIYNGFFDAAIGISGDGWVVVYFNRAEPDIVSLATIVRDTWLRCGGEADELDVADLEARYVIGYTQTKPMAGRGLIEPLRPLGPFDQVESEGVLKFPTRGKATVATLSADELGVHEESTTPRAAVTVKASADQELPRRVRVRYIAQSRDYDPGEQMSPVRFTAAAVSEKDIDLPVVISDELAAQTAEIIWQEAWIARHLYEAHLDVEFLALDPADCVLLPIDGRNYRSRIVNIDDSSGGLMRTLQLLRDDDGAYTSEAVADDPIRVVTSIAIYSLTNMILLDLPPLRDEDDDAGFYAAVYPADPTRSWGGAIVYRSTDGGGTYSAIGSITNSATVVRLLDDLPAGPTTIWDDENEIVVELLAGTLESRTDDDLLSARANGIAIGAHGRWEIVQFANATQETETTWRLSRLLRGRRATEHNVGLGVEGDFGVGLSSGLARMPLQLSDVGTEREYRAVTVHQAFALSIPQEFTGDGEALKPFSPVGIEGERDGSDNLTITWLRRGRIGQELPSGADIPLSEESEEYEVDILDDATSPHTVLRTIEVTSESASYSAADQTTDGLTPGDPVTVRVYQISASVGRGQYGEATV